MTSSRHQNIEPAPSEQRKIVRRVVSVHPASLAQIGENAVEVIIKDISIYGCCLEFDAILPEKEVVKITFDRGDEAEATVVWQNRNRIGCRFAEPIDPSLFKETTREP